MIVYQATKKKFLEDVFSNRIDTQVHEAFYKHLGRHTSPSEVSSWRNSMQYMNTILNNSKVPDEAGVYIEYQLPLTSKRIDFVLSGLNELKQSNVLIIELKQWESAQLTTKDAVVKTRFQYGIQETAHPSYQVWSYAQTLTNFSEVIQNENIKLTPCAYLHNYTPDKVITNCFYEYYIEKAPLFLKNDAAKLRDFIEKHIKYGDSQGLLYKIENGRIRPSKQLADSLASMLKGNQEFIMIDDQKVAFETAMQLASLSKPNKKHVLIVEGGPGTGKSVVAINLLVELTKKRLTTKYVSKNAAPRTVYTELLTGNYKKSYINNLFSGSGAFIDAKENIFDALIVDEAHRLNEKSGLYGNNGENQIKEIIQAAKFSLFFIDENQRIHIKDIGSRAHIEEIAKSLNAKTTTLKLSSQFRCNGSDGYLAWIDNTLQIKETANFKLSRADYDFRVFDNPNDLYTAIEERNKVRNKSRIVAGYCWNWKSKKDLEDYDIEFPEFNFKMQWNLASDGSSWLIRPDSLKEAGCIHTCQGLDLDYVGVIVGDDLKIENGKLITDISARASTDHSIRGIKKLIKENPTKGKELANELIKNTYRTLFTRGLKGCYIYCTDPELSSYFSSFLYAENEQELVTEKPTVEQNQNNRIEADVNDNVKYVDFLPYYTIKAACGAFGDYQEVEPHGWVQTNGFGSLKKNMFVVKAAGNSMEPKIKDGDLCVFRTNVVGSRNNKIVLVQHMEFLDPDNGGRYSIKQYNSEKSYDKETGEWQHEKIILKPLNKSYDPIIIEQEDGYTVIGEFLGIVK